MNIFDRIKEHALSHPDRTAYIHNNERISYRDLSDRVCEYSELLKRQGNGAVIVYGHKSIDMLVSILACIAAKRAYIPIDTYMPLSRIESIIEMTCAELLLYNEPIRTKNIECSSLYELNRYGNLPLKTCKSDIVYIIFTSGSTGEPKGVPISHKNLTNFINWISDIEPLRSYQAAIVMNQASFSFDLSVADIFYTLCNGHTLVAMDSVIQSDPELISNFFSVNKPEITVTTPTFIKLCLLDKEFDKNHIPSLKCMYFCGEQLEKQTVIRLKERFPECRILNAYGPTEATSAVSVAEITKEDLMGDHLLPVGIMTDNATDIYIENDEIILSGKSVFNGYLKETKGGYFNDNGINSYRTGDCGYIKDSKLYCKGRIDTQIKYKGYRIELSDIESNIKKLEGITDAAVIAKSHCDGRVKLIKAFVVCGTAITPRDIKEKLSSLIPQYMIPSQIKIIDKLPLNENKKVDRRSLAEL